MSAWVDEILEQIDGEDQAVLLASRIMSHFDLPGAVFSRVDVGTAIDEYLDGCLGEEDFDDGTRNVLADEYIDCGDWPNITSFLYQMGNEAIAEGVAERMRELGV